MKITVTFEVESRAALVTILKTGADHSLYDYQVLNFEIHKEEEKCLTGSKRKNSRSKKDS